MEKETIYTTAFDAWKFQVEAFWTRSSYFVVFELGFSAGLWKIFEAKHWWTSSGLSIGAIFLTGVWILQNERLNEYINFYWYKLAALEKSLVTDENFQVFYPLSKRYQKALSRQLSNLYSIDTLPISWGLDLDVSLVSLETCALSIVWPRYCHQPLTPHLASEMWI